MARIIAALVPPTVIGAVVYSIFTFVNTAVSAALLTAIAH